jgi:hypothetical protein
MENRYSRFNPLRWFGYGQYQVEERPPDVVPGSVSVDTSLPPFVGMAGELRGQIGILTPLIPREYIDFLFTLSIISPLISQTVHDHITLANSGHQLRIEGGGEARIAQATESLEELARRMHPGGADGWMNVALYQLLVAGVLSHEWVVADDLKSLVRSKFVPSQSIKFKSSGDNDGIYLPIQNQSGRQVELNTATYHYRAIMTWENNPYAIPPLFSAIEPVWVMRDVMSQVRGIARKIGLLGAVQILLDRPKRDVTTNETDAAYRARLQSYLTEAKKKFEGKDFKDGMFIGFKDQHEFKIDSVTANARGLSELYERLDIEAHSGAKNDPSLTGRPFSRTETQIRQIYQKLTKQLGNIRSIAGRSLEQGYELHLALAGFQELTVSVDFNQIDSLDELGDEEVREKQILNARMLYDDGLISQEERARMLGLSDPDQNIPRPKPEAASAAFSKTFECDDRQFEYSPNWPPAGDCGCGEEHQRMSASFAADGGEIGALIEKYVKKANGQIDAAGKQTMEIVEQFLRTAAMRSDPEAFADHLYRVLANEFEAAMTTEQVRETIEFWADKIYRESLLGEGLGLTLAVIDPEMRENINVVFDQFVDHTTVEFLTDTDFFYMGKFVKRSDTADRVKRKLISEYIAVGKDFSDKKFIQGVSDALELEYWQGERIVRTTATTSRNFASLRIMEQAQVIRTFEIVGPLDSITCDWCENMVGRQFTVAKAIMRMRDVIAAGPEALEGGAPFHPSCRHRLVAVA